MNYATIATLAIFALYTAISWAVLGPLDSISQSWYKWKNRDYSAAFNIFGAAVCLACCCQSFYGHEHLTKLFFVLSGACMWLLTVGSPYKTYSNYHYVPTGAAIGFGYAAVWAEFGPSWMFWLSFGCGVVGALLMMKLPYHMTWQELWVLACILIPFL